MSLLKIVGEKLPPSQRSSLENENEQHAMVRFTTVKRVDLNVDYYKFMVDY